MAQNDFWNQIAGPFGESSTRISVAMYAVVFTDIVMGDGEITPALGKIMMGLEPGSDAAQEYDDFVASLMTINPPTTPSFPLGAEGTRAQVVALGDKIAGGTASEVGGTGNPYTKGDDLRLRLGEVIVKAGGTLVGSMTGPPAL